MKKFATVFMLVLLSTVLTSALFADAIVTSYDRNAELVNPSSAQLQEIKTVLQKTGSLTSYEREALMDCEHIYVAPHVTLTRDSLGIAPQSAAYWTGTTSATAFTDDSEARLVGGNAEAGWMMFDVSGIPAGSVINGVTFHGYVNSTNYPYWSMTPVSSDPLTTSADVLYADIMAEATTSADCYLYPNETSSYATGWKAYDMTALAATNLTTAIGGTFPCGLASRDTGTQYHINWDGWNQANPPYLMVQYDPPIEGIGAEMGNVTPAAGNNNVTYTYSVNYMHTLGLAPSTAQVYIDGTPHNLVLPGGTPDWTTWQTLTYETTLPIGLAHEYYFVLEAGTQTVYEPDTAPTTPFYGPDVYSPVANALTIGAAGDYTTIQGCFDDLMLRGIDGATTVTVEAGTYAEEAVLDAPIPGAGTDMVHFVADGEVIVDGAAQTTQAPIYVLNSGDVWFDGFTLINGYNTGFRAEASDNVWVSNCKIYDNGWLGISFSVSTNCWAWNNFLAWNYTQQIGCYDCGVGAANVIWNNSMYGDTIAGGDYMICLTLSNSEATVWNNAMHRNWNGGNGFAIFHFQQQDWTTHPNTYLDYNVYYTEDGCNVATGYPTLAAWQASGDGQDAHSYYGDPMFDDVAATDLHISVTGPSPCLDNGNGAGAWFSDDYDGTTRTGIWDIGADNMVPQGSPSISRAMVDPEVGNELETFEYSCFFYNPTAGSVTNAQVVIDGTPHNLVASVDPNNGTYTYTTTGTDLGAGTHDYKFTFTVSGYGTLNYPAIGQITGPEVEAIPWYAVPCNERFEDVLPTEWIIETDTQSDVYWDAAANASGRVDGGMVMCGNTSTSFTTPTVDNVWDLAAPGGSNALHSSYVTIWCDYTGAAAPLLLNFDYSIFYQYNNLYTNMRVDIDRLDGNGWVQLGEDYRPAGSSSGWLNTELALGVLDGPFKIRFWGSIKYNMTSYTTGVYIDNLNIDVAPPYLLDATVDTNENFAFVGNDAMYEVTIENLGSSADTYTLSVADNNWPTVWDDGASVTVPAGTAYSAMVTVSVPVSPTEPDTTDLIVTSQGSPSNSVTMTVVTSYAGTSGGPDTAGYTWLNSYNAAGPSYDWITPTMRDTIGLPTDDQVIGPFAIGFAFPFYGTYHDSFYFCSNGYIGFTNSQNLTNTVLPTAAVPNDLIAWFWNDLDPWDNPDGDTYIYMENHTLNGMDALVLTMENYHEWSGEGTGKLTAQLIIFANGDIKMQYQSFDGGIVMNSTTVGIENQDGTDGLTYEFNEDLLKPGMAILFVAPIAPPAYVTMSMSGDDCVLTWPAISGATSYHVYMATDPAGTWTEATGSPVSATTFTHTGAGAAGTKYFYYVTADDGTR